jgi:hypothetical protein
MRRIKQAEHRAFVLREVRRLRSKACSARKNEGDARVAAGLAALSPAEQRLDSDAFAKVCEEAAQVLWDGIGDAEETWLEAEGAHQLDAASRERG